MNCEKKYEMTEEVLQIYGRTLRRIRALKNFADVKIGDLGGFIEKDENLSHIGDSWIYGDAKVYDNARIYDNACIFGNARVYDDVRVFGNGLVRGREDIFWISAIGSRNGTTTFFNCEDGKIRVSCGCFYGDLDEFLEAVNKTHGDNEYGQVYRLAIEMARIRIR